jgi:hypothetical protein
MSVREMISTLSRQALKELSKEIREMITTAPKEEKPKRVAAVGQKAWFAFMRHCRDTMAERFTACKSAPEYAVVCKAIRQEDEAVYTAFVEKFKADNSAPTSDAEVSSAKPEAKPVAKPTEKEQKATAKSAEKEQKAAAKSAEKEQKAAAKSAEKEQKATEKAAKKEAAHLAKEAAKEAAKQQKAAEKEVAKQQKAAEKEAAKLAKAAAKPAKATKAKPAPAPAPISTEATPAPAEAEEDAMPKITIDGTAYWHDESTNGLYSIDAAGGFGDWVGYYQPDNEEEPIRYTATPE